MKKLHFEKKLLIEAIIGIVLILGGLYMWRLRLNYEVVNAEPNAPTTAATATAPANATISGQPASISIPSLNMNIPIIPGYYNTKTKQWTLSLSDVQYATITPPPNNASGQTYFYGHYRSAVFARLHLIQIGALTSVTTTNGHVFTYKLQKVEVINPSDSSFLNYQGPPILTVQTCTGALFQNRQLFIFSLVSAQ
jgi:LPXTG-site transpeptidase (sortase) family protein